MKLLALWLGQLRPSRPQSGCIEASDHITHRTRINARKRSIIRTHCGRKQPRIITGARGNINNNAFDC